MDNADDYIYTDPVESLGTEGHCDIAAEVLRERYPEAETWRFTDATETRFAHVFLRMGDKAVDILGFCSFSEMNERHSSEELHPAPTTPAAVHKNFLGHGRESWEISALRKRFQEYIERHAERFPT
jgi:hypothetical protein